MRRPIVPAVQLLAASLGLVAAALPVPPASAAEVTIRPDLFARAVAMKRLFPPRSLAGTEGMKPEDDSAFTGLAAFPAGTGDGANPAVIRIEGEIVKGDAERVKQALQEGPHYPLVISFDSPGGVFAEAFRIAEVLRYDIESQDPRIAGLIVLAGDECLSACAIAFAASVDRAHPDTDTRFVEKGGKLGFHMPYIPEGTDTSGTGAEQMLGLGYDVAAEMVGLLEESANPPGLLLRMLRHRTASSFYVLAGDLETWRMSFTPVAAAGDVSEIGLAGLDTIAVGQLCNLVLKAGPVRMSAAQDEFCDFQLGATAADELKGGKLISDLLRDGARSLNATCGWFTCQMRTDEAGRVGISVWRGSEGCKELEDPFPSGMCPAPAAGVDTVSNFLLAEAYSCRDGKILPATFTAESPAKIKRDVYLRDAPSRNGQVVATLRAESEVEVGGCRVTTDDQGVWYAVERGGTRGWVSARFVGGHAERFAYRGDRFAIEPAAGGGD
ncbi:SH3 domain-containing protein [Jiella sonneratiae]|uniref:SH3 domain-containing protein n=1 Tax=Jiella sonneratiae TaxID=2816856 RepID=A0ABS3J5K0_9HYPH|nr:SH3 domain-containing protein [Jiella sonneratiae]MBO0904954.1 SH3 domain-containing protein [Jiella sonneratiae]